MQPFKESTLYASVGPVAHDWREPKAKTAEFTKRSHSKKLQRKTRQLAALKNLVKKPWDGLQRQKNRRFLKVLLKKHHATL